MLMVLMSALQALVASRSALSDQYYTLLAKEAAESGQRMALECLTLNYQTVTWTIANPLTPATDCAGNRILGQSDYVLKSSTTDTSFSVPPPANQNGVWSINVSGLLHKTRSSNGDVWRTYNAVSNLKSILPVLVSIDGGWSHVIGLTADRKTIYTWGSNGSGQLGDGTTKSSTVPSPVITKDQLDGSFIQQVSSGGAHTMVLTSSGKIFSWGDNQYGQLGDGTTTNRLKPVQISGEGTSMAGKFITYITAGKRMSVAVDSGGNVYQWGVEPGGNYGTKESPIYTTPRLVDAAGTPMAGKKVKRCETNTNTGSILCLTIDNGLYAWGSNTVGQLGDGTMVDRLSPVAVTVAGTPLAGKVIKDIVVGTHAHYFLTTDNVIAAVGANYRGQFANGTTTWSSVPTLVPTAGTPLAGKTIVQLTGDGHFAAALTSEGKVYEWGGNEAYQLGIGVQGPYSCGSNPYSPGPWCNMPPQEVLSSGTPMFSRKIIQIAAGDTRTYAVASDGTAYSWGSNDNGVLGLGTNAAYQTVPGQMVFRPQTLNY